MISNTNINPAFFFCSMCNAGKGRLLQVQLITHRLKALNKYYTVFVWFNGIFY